MKRKVFKVAVTLGAIAGLISPMAQPFTSGAQETIQSLEKVKMSEDGEYQGFSYTHYFHTNEVSIWGYSGEDEALVIPEKINGWNVTCLDMSFTEEIPHADKIKSVTLPKTLKDIGVGAMDLWAPDCLQNLPNLEKVIVAEGNEHFSVEEGVLYWKGTEKNLWCCPRKSGITSIKIPSDVDFVHDYAFYKNETLQQLIIPKDKMEITNKTFVGCENITKTYYEPGQNKLPDTVHMVKTSEDGRYQDFSYIHYYDNDTVNITGYYGKETNVVLPDTINGWKVTHFSGSTKEDIPNLDNIVSVTLPKDLKGIGNGVIDNEGNLDVLQNMPNLKKIIVPNSNKYFVVQDSVLYNLYYNEDKTVEKTLYCCPRSCGRKKITVASDVNSIYKYAFFGNKTLKEVVIPKSVKLIGDGTFVGCEKLTKVIMNQPKLTLKKGKKKRVQPKLMNKISSYVGTKKKAKISFKSSKPKYLSVSKKGIVKARKKGKATISITSKTGKVKWSCKLSVNVK